MLRRNLWLTCVDSRVRTVHHGSLGMLSLRINAAARTAAGQGRDPGTVLRLRAAGAEPLPVLILPFRPRCESWGRTQPTVLLLFRDPARSTRPSHIALRQTYDLSPAEARLVALLVEGNSLMQAAELAGISPNTAKSQLRSAFARTGFSRQADLVGEIRGNPIVQIGKQRGKG